MFSLLKLHGHHIFVGLYFRVQSGGAGRGGGASRVMEDGEVVPRAPVHLCS